MRPIFVLDNAASRFIETVKKEDVHYYRWKSTPTHIDEYVNDGVDEDGWFMLDLHGDRNPVQVYCNKENGVHWMNFIHPVLWSNGGVANPSKFKINIDKLRPKLSNYAQYNHAIDNNYGVRWGIFSWENRSVGIEFPLPKGRIALCDITLSGWYNPPCGQCDIITNHGATILSFSDSQNKNNKGQDLVVDNSVKLSKSRSDVVNQTYRSVFGSLTTTQKQTLSSLKVCMFYNSNYAPSPRYIHTLRVR